MLYCPECGEPISNSNNICDVCGTKATRKQAFGMPAGTLKILCIVVSVILLLFLIGGLIIVFAGEKSKSIKTHSIIDETQGKIKKQLPSIIKTGGNASTTFKKFHKEATKGAEIIFGKDNQLDSSLKNNDLPKNITDTETKEQYNYLPLPMPALFTDIMQLGGYSFQQELAKSTKISIEEENRLGDKIEYALANGQYKGKLNKNKKLSAYINKLGRFLANKAKRRGINYKFFVVENDSFNACAYPGGRIYVNTGLLKRLTNEAQLASVLAHEIKHVDLRHTIVLYQIVTKMPGKQSIAGFLLYMAQLAKHPYQGRVEADADRRGLELIYSCGYSPFQVVELWKKIAGAGREKSKKNNNLFEVMLNQAVHEAENVLNTHPAGKKRYIMLQNHTIKLLNKYPKGKYYIGKWNFKTQIPMYKTMK